VVEARVVLDDDTAAYYPAAFDDAGRAALAAQFTELIEAKDEDAEVLGLNAISDGRHVVLPAQATSLAAQLAAAGFEPVPVDMSEFRKSGGGPKCCTLELR
jgi:N-dimethylarginine dimethylaminohydrolase